MVQGQGHGHGNQTRVHLKGQHDDFIVLVESAQAVRDWRKDKSVALAQVVDGFKVFVTHNQGVQGIMDTASHQTLDTEFGTHKDEEVIVKILEKGDIHDVEEHGRSSNRNITKGSGVAH